jgi:transcription elongation factor GreA
MVYFTKKSLESYIKKYNLAKNSANETSKELGDSIKNSTDSWHDNPDYDSLLNEVKIKDNISNSYLKKLNDYKIIDYSNLYSEGVVSIGTTIEFSSNGDDEVLSVVAYGHDDVSNGLILYDAPYAESLLGHKVGDKFTIENKLGKEIIEIKKVSRFYE